MADKKTESALKTVAKDPKDQPEVLAGAAGKESEENGVKAIVNPELRDVGQINFPTEEEGKFDSYENGKVHTVPAALLEVKNSDGVAYLVPPNEEDSE